DWNGRYPYIVDYRIDKGMEVRVCEQCLKPFPLYADWRRFCSDACRARHWRENTRRCAFCGKRFSRKHHQERYCSKRCKNRAAHNQFRPSELPPRKCAYCGTEFAINYHTWKSKRYCSYNCSKKDRLRRKRPELAMRACLECGTLFQPKHPEHHYCSDLCYQRQYQRAYYYKLKERNSEP